MLFLPSATTACHKYCRSNPGLQVGEKVQRVQHEQPVDLPGRDQADHGREQPRHGDYRQSQGSR